MIEVKLLIGLHILFAGIFSGTNVYLDFIFTPALSKILPGQALRVGDRVGVRVAVLTLGSLLGLPATGLALLYRFGGLGSIGAASFYANGYGAALATMMLAWASAFASGLVMLFYLRPMAVVRLPIDAPKDVIEAARDRGIKAATWMGRLAKYNAFASFIAIFVGGFLRYGGF